MLPTVRLTSQDNSFSQTNILEARVSQACKGNVYWIARLCPILNTFHDSRTAAMDLKHRTRSQDPSQGVVVVVCSTAFESFVDVVLFGP